MIVCEYSNEYNIAFVRPKPKKNEEICSKWTETQSVIDMKQRLHADDLFILFFCESVDRLNNESVKKKQS